MDQVTLRMIGNAAADARDFGTAVVQSLLSRDKEAFGKLEAESEGNGQLSRNTCSVLAFWINVLAARCPEGNLFLANVHDTFARCMADPDLGQGETQRVMAEDSIANAMILCPPLIQAIDPALCHQIIAALGATCAAACKHVSPDNPAAAARELLAMPFDQLGCKP